ncbi:MAG: DUF481 domain-containing protein [Bacteroidales bacterium]|nr:DUF481 domain-containing protein [Bacteroidales bacterium]
MKISKKLIVFVFFVFLSSSVFSQLVNIEKERKSYKEGFQGFVTFSFDVAQSTSKIIQVSNLANFQFVKKKHTFLILNDYTIMQVQKDQDNIDLINKNFQHFRYNFSIVDTNKVSFETFVQRQQNKIKFLKLRALAGAGFRFNIINNKNFVLNFAILSMYENEILSDSINTNTKMLKGDMYLSFSLKIIDHLYFSNVTYYQPALADFNNFASFEQFNDFRIFSDFSFSFVIFKNLEFSLAFESAYDSRPPLELVNNKLFYDISNKLTYKF